ncbi:Oxidoreductase [Mycoemilia scoparia]|uniref:Mitochondrial intermembrane space import and assembly protein 40 n=1 Tax=Mycoemilia scoparia TaxID=417184 RepID=A0A9W8AC01_9FUNG|nr:Oxidoreductase [Mycoemilia scoparia]
MPKATSTSESTSSNNSAPPQTAETSMPIGFESTESTTTTTSEKETGADKSSESQSDAFNPETGEINWDCPCLGGMAHGTCGEQFKAAFSCFVYSKEEPKGVDCIDAFKAMQDCFRAHPEEYANEIDDDDDDDDDEESQGDKKAGDSNEKILSK